MKNLKLNRLNPNKISEKQANAIRGGQGCSCGCQWAGNGGSSVQDNGMANSERCIQTQYEAQWFATCPNP